MAFVRIDLNKLNYKNFQKLAKHCQNDSLRVGFPEEYRVGKIDYIVYDIFNKLSNLNLQKKNFLEIGPGWSKLTKEILTHCKNNQHSVTLIDSMEMLSLIPKFSFVKKIAGKFPEEVFNKIKKNKYDAILIYSVLQYPFLEGNMNYFIDCACELLAEGGQLLIGDIPNISMRKRFFASSNGINTHRQFMKNKKAIPEVKFNKLEKGYIDDGVLIGILTRARSFGLHAFVVPQYNKLPMSNRREDILIIKP